jgi:hypothetical protein
MSTTKETIKRKERNKTASADSRQKPLTDFLFTEYKKQTGIELNPAFGASDGKALQDLLKKTPKLPLEELQKAWAAFLQSDDPFDRKQFGAHPVCYWASRINKFLLMLRKPSRELEVFN